MSSLGRSTKPQLRSLAALATRRLEPALPPLTSPSRPSESEPARRGRGFHPLPAARSPDLSLVLQSEPKGPRSRPQSW